MRMRHLEMDRLNIIAISRVYEWTNYRKMNINKAWDLEFEAEENYS